ncbi:hypothetical protein PJ912_27245 [Pectobacterium colocasium]|uniref:hypothetical protein n=1 Tax=Pectobacterium TaxID=122277 RepID=UPI003D749EF0|nr:hypothetical protein KXZ65_15675 [Pectobacterium sp. PL152]
MNILTNERLNKIASWCETYGTNTNVMIPAKEAEELVQRLLRAETKLADLYAQKPFMHGIGAPDGNAYFDECCVGNVGLMDAQVTNLNGDLDEGDPRYSVVALYRDPIPDDRNERIAKLEAQLAVSGQKAKNYEEVAHGLSGEVNALKTQLAELGSQEPVSWQFNWHKEGWMQCKNKREYDEIITNGNKNFEVRELYARPVPQAVSQQEYTLSQIRDILHIGSEVPLFCIVENVKNANRFADQLAAIEQEFFMVPDEDYHTDDDDQNDEPCEKCLVNRWGSTTEQYVDQFRKALKHIVRPISPVASDPCVINLTDEQIDSVLDSRGNILYVIGDKREKLRLFAREILRVASAQWINAVPLHIVPDELPKVPNGGTEVDSYNKDKTDS